MRILNESQLRVDLHNLARLIGSPKYADWLSKGVSKWLLRKSPSFTEMAIRKVEVQKSSSSFEVEGLNLDVFHVVDHNGTRNRLHLSDEFDQQDAHNGSLFYYMPKISLNHWLFVDNPLLVEARDFLEEKVRENPDVDLRKYTLETLPRQIELWQEAKARKQQRELERMRREALAENAMNARADDSLADASNKVITYQQAWDALVVGQDYELLFETSTYCAYMLLSRRALLWEATYKGNCIAGYGGKLGLNTVKLVSYRPKDPKDTSTPFTIELVWSAGRWNFVQFEAWGYSSPLNRTNSLLAGEIRTQKAIFQSHLLNLKGPAEKDLVYEFQVGHR